MTRKEFQKKLSSLAATIRRRPYTANELAKVFRTTRAAIYRRLAALKADVKLKSQPVREGERGPEARAFYVLR